MSKELRLTGITSASLSADRTAVAIELVTDQGALTLNLDAQDLAYLITSLLGVEYQASIEDSGHDRMRGERGRRVSIVDQHEIGNCVASGMPSVLLGLRSGQALRWFAIAVPQATDLQQALMVEIRRAQTTDLMRN